MKKNDRTWQLKQKHLFELIKNKIDKNLNFIHVLANTLGISEDAAYRRVHCITVISAEEFDILCRKFNISADKILNYNYDQDVSFKYLSVIPDHNDSYIQYLNQLHEILMKSTSAGNSEFIFTAYDIPFYYFPSYPELFYFKLYERHIRLSDADVSYNEFCGQFDKKTIMPLYKQIVKMYMQIPSKEVWNVNTVLRTLQSLKYYFETKCFDNNTALLLLQQLSKLVHTVENDASKGIREESLTPFAMYISSLDIPHNIMIMRHDSKISCDIRLFTANSFFIDDEHICSDIYKEEDDVLRKSILVTGGLKHERCGFFTNVQNDIATVIDEIEDEKN
jgi:hypothetical protein